MTAGHNIFNILLNHYVLKITKTKYLYSTSSHYAQMAMFRNSALNSLLNKWILIIERAILTDTSFDVFLDVIVGLNFNYLNVLNLLATAIKFNFHSLLRSVFCFSPFAWFACWFGWMHFHLFYNIGKVNELMTINLNIVIGCFDSMIPLMHVYIAFTLSKFWIKCVCVCDTDYDKLCTN